MGNQSENTKRIAKNTVMLYIRMLFGMLVSLYTSRVVLNTLGVEDYGIYNVVGGFVGMLSLISGSLSASTSRFLTFELGKGDKRQLERIFSTSLSIHIILVLLIFILAETVGIWFLNTQMIIPPERIDAANWVFQASVLSFMLGLFSVPYNALIIAHERMSAFAYIGILDIVLRLIVVLFIAYGPWKFDRLIVYALLLVVVSTLLQSIYFYYCVRHFKESRLHFSFDKIYWKEMSAFAGWGFMGSAAGAMSNQGVNILLNIFWGPTLNAARGISNTVNTAINSFVGNFVMALNPQITKSYATNDYEYMMSLTERGARFSFYILFIFALPILLETDFVLTLWLGRYPIHTTNFVRLILLLSMFDVLTNTLVTLQLATGHIKNYQLAVGGALLMNFPLSYLCLKAGFQPESVYIVAILISVCCMCLRLFFLKNMVGLSIKNYFKKVCLNAFLVFLGAVVIPMIVYLQMSPGWIRFVLICFFSFLCSGISICFIGCSTSERRFIFDKLNTFKENFRNIF